MMANKFARVIQRLTGFLLAGIGVVAQMSNILICLALISLSVAAILFPARLTA